MLVLKIYHQPKLLFGLDKRALWKQMHAYFSNKTVVIVILIDLHQSVNCAFSKYTTGENYNGCENYVIVVVLIMAHQHYWGHP